MKRLHLNILSNLALMWVGSMAQATTYYVATTGHDGNLGTQAQPFKTIQRGLNSADTGDRVLVAAGTYVGTGNKNLDFGARISLSPA